jgi:hypothetical protein
MDAQICISGARGVRSDAWPGWLSAEADEFPRRTELQARELQARVRVDGRPGVDLKIAGVDDERRSRDLAIAGAAFE